VRNIGEIALLNARYYPNKRAVVDSTKEFTWNEVNERANRIANALISMGCRKGERIAILSYNSSEYIEITFACAKLGLVFVPLNFRLALKEIAYILKDSTPTTLFFGEAFSEIASNLKSSFTLNYICIGEKIEWAHEYEAFVSSGPPPWNHPPKKYSGMIPRRSYIPVGQPVWPKAYYTRTGHVWKAP